MALLLFPHQQYSINILKPVIDKYNIKQIILCGHENFYTNKCNIKKSFLNDTFKNYQAELINKIPSIIIKQTTRLPKNKTLFIKPYDYKLQECIKKHYSAPVIFIELPFFILTDADRKEYMTRYKNKPKKRYLFTAFYIWCRKKYKILLTSKGEPLGGKWSFDKENQGTPPNKTTKLSPYLPLNKTGTIDYATNRKDAIKSFKNFIKTRLNKFGNYQDFYDKHNYQVNHSLLSPYLNIALLTPKSIIKTVIAHANTPINSKEGFIRQLFWREYMYLIYYINKGSLQMNYFNNNKPMPKNIWKATTGIDPVDHALKLTYRLGYLHHIERLMVLGSYMLLLEISPHEVYNWFNNMYVDAYDWVMFGNVYMMSQYADNRFTTRPYFSSSKYIIKMSNFSKDDWCDKWDQLFRAFLKRKQSKLKHIYMVSRWLK